MNHFYILIGTIVLAFQLKAQPILTKAFNEPMLGDVNTKQLCDSVGIVPKITGANKVWDFSGFTINTNVEVSNFTNTSSTPNGSSYTGATFVEEYGTANYSYMKVTPTKYELVGVETSTFKLNLSSNTATQFIWPVGMGYAQSDAFSGTANANNMNGSVSGNISTLGSGTGTLIIPGGVSFAGVLQVKMTLSAAASFAFGLVTVNLKIVEYTYYDAFHKFPLLTVVYTDASGAYTSKSADIKVNASIVVINDFNFDAAFNVFPNPARDEINIKLSNPNHDVCKVQIMNSTGQILELFDFGNDTEILNQISISKLPAGLYIVKTALGNKTSTRKLIIE